MKFLPYRPSNFDNMAILARAQPPYKICQQTLLHFNSLITEYLLVKNKKNRLRMLRSYIDGFAIIEGLV